MNSFQREAITELTEAGFEARPCANWVEVLGGYRPEPIFTVAGVNAYIANNEPTGREEPTA